MNHTEADLTKPLVLITGACGYLGQSLVHEFQLAGFTVRALDVAAPPSHCEPDELILGSVADAATVAASVSGVSALVIAHMAPQRPGVYDTPDLPFDINVKGTELLCTEAARQGLKRVVLISSISVVEGYRKAGIRFLRNLPAQPTSLYGLTKHLQEQILNYHDIIGDFSAINLRVSYVSDADNLTDKYQRQRPSVNWQFIDRRDIAGGAIAAIKAKDEIKGTYYLHGHHDGPTHLETEPTEQDLKWTPNFDFSNWPDDVPKS